MDCLLHQDAAKHLGHMIGPMENDINIDLKSKELFTNLNHILAVFGNSTYKVKYRLFKSFCMPLYGCVLCGTIPVKILKGFLFHGESALENYCFFHNVPTVIYCLC